MFKCTGCSKTFKTESGGRRHIERVHSFAGMISTAKCRETGTQISIWHSNEAGIETDPAVPFAITCDDHGTVMCFETRAQAFRFAPQPSDWCEDCQEIFSNK